MISNKFWRWGTMILWWRRCLLLSTVLALRSSVADHDMYCVPSECEERREEALSVIGAAVPSCLEDGTYASVQCHASIGTCWCATSNGTEIEGTRATLPAFPECSEPELPSLPDSFSARIEANIRNRNYTIVIDEHHDYTNNRVVIATHREGQVTTRHLFLDQDIEYQSTTTECEQQIISEQDGIFGGGHLGHTADFYHFGSQYNLTYQGVASVRGVRCEMWRSERHDERQAGTFRITSRFYFSDGVWQLPDVTDPSQRTLIRITIEGQRESSSGTYAFEHYYDFFDFSPGIPSPTIFELPASCKSPQKSSNSIVPTIVIFSLVLGMLLGMGVGAQWRRHKQKQRGVGTSRLEEESVTGTEMVEGAGSRVGAA